MNGTPQQSASLGYMADTELQALNNALDKGRTGLSVAEKAAVTKAENETEVLALEEIIEFLKAGLEVPAWLQSSVERLSQDFELVNSQQL